jgi:hypothetical protein
LPGYLEASVDVCPPSTATRTRPTSLVSTVAGSRSSAMSTAAGSTACYLGLGVGDTRDHREREGPGLGDQPADADHRPLDAD